jgi:hypothetical protein
MELAQKHWYHASEYLPPVAEAAFGKDTPPITPGWSRPVPCYGKVRSMLSSTSANHSLPLPQLNRRSMTLSPISPTIRSAWTMLAFASGVISSAVVR